MDINRTGPRNTQSESPAQRTGSEAAASKDRVLRDVDSVRSAPPAGVPAGLTRADLSNAGKYEDTLQQCFSSMLENKSAAMGTPLSNEQNRDLAEFLGDDPLTRGKMLSYLDQALK
jgi:hypothetical protein